MIRRTTRAGSHMLSLFGWTETQQQVSLAALVHAGMYVGEYLCVFGLSVGVKFCSCSYSMMQLELKRLVDE